MPILLHEGKKKSFSWFLGGETAEHGKWMDWETENTENTAYCRNVSSTQW